MRTKFRLFAVLAAFALLLVPAAALAVPVMPMQFEGNVTIGGVDASVGTIISAEVAGEEIATNAPDGISQEGYYRLDVSASEGDLVELYVDGNKGGEATYPDPMSTWHVVCNLAIEGEVPVTYTLTMAVSGSGTVSPVVGQYTYAADTVVPIIATPATGYDFDSWTGDVACATCASTTVTMDSDKSVTAYFESVGPLPEYPTFADWMYYTFIA